MEVRRPRRPARRRALLGALLLAACGPAAPLSTPTPSPDPPLAWPTRQLEPLPPGRYAISPPFDIPFVLDVPEGWSSLHLHGEFTDLGWFTGEAAGVPEWIIAFGHPETLRGPDGDVEAGGRPADEAVALLRARSDLDSTEPAAFEIDGRPGRRVDVLAPAFDTRLYSGPGPGGLGIGPDKAVRVGFVLLADGEALIVTVHADPGDLEAAWAAALPILASIELTAA